MSNRATTNCIGRSLELFFIEGKPDGMLTAEVFNWTGHILRTPRTRLADALQRKEAAHTGVYLLVGEGDDGTQIYVGEGHDIGRRIRSHDSNKDWWDTAVLITTAADSLNKAHVQYLEARLLREARDAGKANIENDTNPALPSLSEAAETNMEAFLEHLVMVLPALAVDCFVHNTRTRTSTPGDTIDPRVEAEFELHNRKQGLHATARMEDGEFIVEAGSQARPDWSGSGGSHRQLYLALIKNGILAEGGAADLADSRTRVRGQWTPGKRPTRMEDARPEKRIPIGTTSGLKRAERPDSSASCPPILHTDPPFDGHGNGLRRAVGPCEELCVRKSRRSGQIMPIICGPSTSANRESSGAGTRRLKSLP